MYMPSACMPPTDRIRARACLPALVQPAKHTCPAPAQPPVPCSVCGTLINFSADSGRKGELAALGAPGKLVEVLGRCMGEEEPGDMEVGVLWGSGVWEGTSRDSRGHNRRMGSLAALHCGEWLGNECTHEMGGTHVTCGEPRLGSGLCIRLH